MAGFTELEAQWLADGGRISARALARALGLIDHKEVHKLIEQDLEELEYCNELVVCLQDHNGTDEETKEFFLSEGQCFVLVCRGEFMGTAAFAHFQTVVAKWAATEDDDRADEIPPRGMVH